MKRVYVAGAYSADNVLGLLDNIRKGLRWSTQVFLAGHAPFAPWLDFHFQLMLRDRENLTVEQYYQYSLEWLRVSDVIFVTPGWENSRGTHAEIAEAERLGIPVVYSIEALNPTMHEDELPKTMTDEEYQAWYAQSSIPEGGGCRIGPVFKK